MRWLLFLAACGRVDFDALAPACAGHDEDGDGVPDVCDVCPHIADDQADRDGDGVGDACDQHPDDAIDHIAFFDPFVAAGDVWTFRQSQPTYSGEDLEIDATPKDVYFAANYPHPPASGSYLFGAEIVAVNAAKSQLSISGFAGEGGYYYCELDAEGAGNTALAQTYTLDNDTFERLSESDSAVDLAPGEVSMALVDEPPTFTCNTSWFASPATLTSEIPLTATSVEIGTNNAHVRFHWFIAITSEP